MTEVNRFYKWLLAVTALIVTSVALAGYTLLDVDDSMGASPTTAHPITQSQPAEMATTQEDLTGAMPVARQPGVTATTSPATVSPGRPTLDVAASATVTRATAPADSAVDIGLSTAVQRVVDRVRPAVAFLAVTTQEAGGFPQQVPQTGVGSGVIYDPEGLILTNNHVVACAAQIEVILPDGRKFKGRVLGRDPRTDLAVVEIEGRDLPSAPLGDSGELEIGEWSWPSATH